jgi:UDP-2,4-diacetamido-2,4,6-trideoxy-beta-L-altropyranose hydrolase
MEVAIRVDASTTIGLGHLKRCLTLAEELRVFGGRVVFVVRDLGIDVERQVFSAGFQSFTLPAANGDYRVTQCEGPPHVAWAGTDWETDARQTAAALSGFPLGWLVVDHYSFDARWHLDVAARLNVRVMAIDDLADRPFSVDVLLDHNVDANDREKYAGLISSRTKLLGGPRFALLAPPYRNSVTYEFHDTVRSIGIFMGGVDAPNFSSTVLRACREVAAFTGPIEVVTTGSNPNLSELRSLIATWPLTQISVDLPNLADFYVRHDLQIGAGGGATWERAATGVP